jgi:hypothetical protein
MLETKDLRLEASFINIKIFLTNLQSLISSL